MTVHRPAPSSVPTLTEVVEMPWSKAQVQAPQPEAAMLVDAGAEAASLQPGVVVSAPSEEQIVQRVLLDLQRQIDLMLDYRLREALTPVLTRATDALVLEARHELTSTLRDIVARSVAQEMSRHRGR